MPAANATDTDDALESSRRLIAGLDNPFAFGHPLRELRVIETHISWVILTGDYAYKIKKPVDFGFLDFSTLDKRRFYCDEELRLNRRFAPQLYLEVVPICGTPAKPHLHGSGDTLDYAIRMRQFPQSALLSAHAERGDLSTGEIDEIAASVAAAHRNCERADPDGAYGTASSIRHWSDENLAHLRESIPADRLPPSFGRLCRRIRHDETLEARFEQRLREGFVRECHGDLHLGNMADIDGRVTLFDCIEFNPELRWIDTISEVAFVAMDLQARGYPGLSWRFLDRYLAANGDYGGIDLLRYYFVYRALVRAKVEALRVHPDAAEALPADASFAAAIDYLELADRWASEHRAGLILMHGVSGSGKSTVAAALVEALGAIRVRSDVERKRLFGLDEQADSGSGVGGGIYREEASERTYLRLAELARGVIDADFCVIVDAACLKFSQRRLLLEPECERPFARIIVDCDAPQAELERRLLARKGDASEAGVAVLRQQQATRELLGDADRSLASVVHVGADGLSREQIERIRRLLFGQAVEVQESG